MRWRKVFPGREDQVPLARRFVAGLLDGHPACEDAVLCVAELAANAVRHTASGHGGFFVTEVSWTGTTVRVAVADGGAHTEPVSRHLDPDALEETGHGLHVVARLSGRCGSDGDRRGRVVWAEFTTGEAAPSGACFPLCPEPAVTEDAATLAQRYAGWHTWFGRWTGQWWAVPRRNTTVPVVVLEPTAAALASRLDAMRERAGRAGR